MHVTCRCMKSFAYRGYTNHHLAWKSRPYALDVDDDADGEDEVIPVSKPKKGGKKKTIVQQ